MYYPLCHKPELFDLSCRKALIHNDGGIGFNKKGREGTRKAGQGRAELI